jgi:fatty acid desaturase
MHAKSLKDAEWKERLQQLRQTDNHTNLYYLARTYLYLAAVVGGAVWFDQWRAAAGLSVWWDVPVTLAAVILIGVGQHQLVGLAHEAAHYILFRNRYLNELASDWLCLFPLFSTTLHYRLQHLAHHQYVNDPQRDPDVAQLRASGHWLDFPLSPGEFLWALLKQAWLPNLFRYARVRARLSAVPAEDDPYRREDVTPSRIPVRVGIAYLLGLAGVLTALVRHGDPVLLAVVPASFLAAVLTFYALIPDRLYHQSRIPAPIGPRGMTLMRMTFSTALFSALAWATLLTGEWVVLYFLLLWVVPTFTSFSFLMVLRQVVQHGNGGRGWLTNTRVFFVHRLIRFGVFPIGQDYHLPHHLFMTVPHYRLGRLHELLLEYPEYRDEAVIVEGYFLPRHRPPTRPTVLDVLGPAYAPREPAVPADDRGRLIEGPQSARTEPAGPTGSS